MDQGVIVCEKWEVSLLLFVDNTALAADTREKLQKLKNWKKVWDKEVEVGCN